MRSRLLSGLTLAVVGALTLGCGGGGGGGTPTGPSGGGSGSGGGGGATTQTHTVNVVGSVGNTAYQPNPVRAASGDTVMFRNNDSVLHHILMDDGSADLGDIAPGATSRGFTVRNSTALRFHCSIHPSMVGSINGETAPDPPCVDNYGYEC
jgi:plastocyanin